MKHFGMVRIFWNIHRGLLLRDRFERGEDPAQIKISPLSTILYGIPFAVGVMWAFLLRRNHYIEIKNPQQIVRDFAGKVLIDSYQTSPEKQYYLGDLIEVGDILSALYQITEHEASLTREGIKYFSQLVQETAIREVLQKYDDGQDILSDVMNGAEEIHIDPDPTMLNNRCFSSRKSERQMRAITRRLKTPLTVLLSGKPPIT